jgi:hypothetical protein
MPSDPQTAPVSNKMLWTGRIMSFLPALLLLFGGIVDVVSPQSVAEGTVKMGYPASLIPGLGVVVLLCTILYLIPRTAVLGAILLTAYLGGAVATHVRIGDFRSVPIPILVAVLFWGGLYLRERRLRALIPLRS